MITRYQFIAEPSTLLVYSTWHLATSLTTVRNCSTPTF